MRNTIKFPQNKRIQCHQNLTWDSCTKAHSSQNMDSKRSLKNVPYVQTHTYMVSTAIFNREIDQGCNLSFNNTIYLQNFIKMG